MACTGITIVLELDGTADSPTGRAHVPGGPARAFHGWLGLTAAIDALVRVASVDPGLATSNHEEERER